MGQGEEGLPVLESVVSWAVTALVVVTLAAFSAYLVAVRRLPDERPRVATYDRYGRLMGWYENPGHRVSPGRNGDPLQRRQGTD